MSANATLNPVASLVSTSTAQAQPSPANPGQSDAFSNVLQQKMQRKEASPERTQAPQPAQQNQTNASNTQAGGTTSPTTPANANAGNDNAQASVSAPVAESPNDIAAWLAPLLPLTDESLKQLVQAAQANQAGETALSETSHALTETSAAISPLAAALPLQLNNVAEPVDKSPRQPASQTGLLNTSAQNASAQTADLAQEAANLAASADISKGPAHGHAKAGPDTAGAEFAQALAVAHERSNTATAPAQPTVQAPLQQPVGTQAWSQELGERLVWMSNRQESRADMVLNPPQLGKIEVSLNINGDQASVSLVSANPQVRDALESAINRLREVLAENGINLGQANVGAESSGQSFQQANRQGGGKGRDEDAAPLSSLPWQQQSNSMVDVFA